MLSTQNAGDADWQRGTGIHKSQLFQPVSSGGEGVVAILAAAFHAGSSLHSSGVQAWAAGSTWGASISFLLIFSHAKS